MRVKEVGLDLYRRPQMLLGGRTLPFLPVSHGLLVFLDCELGVCSLDLGDVDHVGILSRACIEEKRLIGPNASHSGNRQSQWKDKNRCLHEHEGVIPFVENVVKRVANADC